jgi:hypothetical protein
MILSHKYKFIMVHPRKTAGTAISKLFEKLDPETIETNKQFNSHHPPYNHQTASQIKTLVGDDVWNSYYKFAFIRDPFSWFRSYYLFELKMIFPYPDKIWDPIRILLEWKNKFQLKNDTITKDNFISLYTMMKWWYRPHGKVGQISWLDEPLDRICIFENLDDEITFLSNKLGFPNEKLQKINVGTFKKTVMDNEVYSLISLFFKDDIELYNKTKLNNKY